MNQASIPYILGIENALAESEIKSAENADDCSHRIAGNKKRS